jgi:NADPH2:quinone reductase
VVLPEGVSAAEGAAIFVNPLTALGMIDTMRREGHSALVHTAAASNLGQMLNRICLADGIPLVNVVRNDEQAQLLRGIGATHVCNSSSPAFAGELTAQLVETGATLAFDAIGGGTLASQILACMEAALSRTAKTYSRYGSTTLKQVYIYGALDMSPTILKRDCGFAFAVGGWLLFPYLERIGKEATRALQARVLAELKTTFASRYAKVISLTDVVDPKEIAVYSKRSTGAKFLIDPNA